MENISKELIKEIIRDRIIECCSRIYGFAVVHQIKNANREVERTIEDVTNLILNAIGIKGETNPKINKLNIGDIIYVPSFSHITHGKDDFCGGKAHVSGIRKGVSVGNVTLFIEIMEDKGEWYNLEFLLSKQNKLKKRYGDEIAEHCPDYRSEFNGGY
ncbi:MAG: hypothetical protein KAX49_11805 [Halanaerobiales bacterium]|nr:hypothetical protein [Halanaerobiales bacterium]